MGKLNHLTLNNAATRRNFIRNSAILSVACTLIPALNKATAGILPSKAWTVREIIDLFIKDIKGAPLPSTVDTLKSGSYDAVVTGIVTTMFATIDVIKKAIALNANFIIAHEPTFYNHEDKTGWLTNDPVYQYKHELLTKHNITVWRNHDYIHTLNPDGVKEGLLSQLGWKSYPQEGTNLVVLPNMQLKDLISKVKERLNVRAVRYIGDLNQNCSKILLMPGAAGGNRQIEAIAKTKPDVLVCGEVAEWETAEYIRDGRASGQNVSLIVLGHIASEEAGSEFMLEWLHKNVPGVKAEHIKAGNSLQFG